MKRTRTALVLFACAAIILSTPGATQAGDPTPPAGPVGPTMKTLDEIEPRIPVGPVTTPGDADSLYRITAPGSYYLTENLIGVSNKHGIEIDAVGVTLDLAGFSVIGASNSLDGISVSVNVVQTNLTALRIKDGVVRDWGLDGVNASLAEGATISNIQAKDNLAIGINLGNNGVITDCVAELSLIGIRVDSGSVVDRCAVSRCTNWGIYALDSCVVTNCSSTNNTGIGIQVLGGAVHACSAGDNGGSGIVGSTAPAERGVTVTASHAFSNTGFGIDVKSSGTVVDCSAVYNDAGGIRTGEGSSVVNSVAFDSGGFGIADGITVGRASQVRGCTASRNQNGIVAGESCTIIECNSEGNDGSGFLLGNNNTVADCTASSNSTVGILVGFVSRVRDCSIFGNGGTGIFLGRESLMTQCVINGHVVAGAEIDQSCRVEDNLFTNNNFGIMSLGGGNMIVRNTFRFSASADHSAAFPDKIAPFEDPTTSTNPWANFSY